MEEISLATEGILQSTEVGDLGSSVIERVILSDQEIRTEEVDDHATDEGKERWGGVGVCFKPREGNVETPS